MRPGEWVRWLSVVGALGCDGGTNDDNSGCSFQSISRSGGLCTLTLSCGAGPVGISCSDTDCVCTADGAGGARFDVAGACGMSNDALTALYVARCPSAAVDAGTEDAAARDVVAPADVPVVDVPDVPMCRAFNATCNAANQCCSGGCAATVVSPETVCCLGEGRSCGTGAGGSCCLPFFCRVLSGSIRACR